MEKIAEGIWRSAREGSQLIDGIEQVMRLTQNAPSPIKELVLEGMPFTCHVTVATVDWAQFVALPWHIRGIGQLIIDAASDQVSSDPCKSLQAGPCSTCK